MNNQPSKSTAARLVLATALLAAMAAALAGCNTVRGAGEDLTKAADATEKAVTGDKK
jgi:predicted small secreted protein